MSFHDLPQQWPSMPLSDPTHIADVLDLFVDLRVRREGGLLLLACDHERRPVQPIVIDGLAQHPPADLAAELAPIAAMLASSVPGASVLCAIARPGRLRLTGRDHAWQRALADALSGRIDLLGVHLVTTHGSMPIPPLESAA